MAAEGRWHCSSFEAARKIASSRRSVSQGAAQKTARGKKKSAAHFLFLSRAVFYAVPRLTERLEANTGNRARKTFGTQGMVCSAP